MRKTVISVLSILFFIAINFNTFAQSKGIKKLLEKPGKGLVASDNKSIKKWQIKKGFASQADYTMPKNVGILTFVVHDRSSSSSYTAGGWKHSSTAKATKDGTSMVANEIYFNVIEGFKESFSAKGMNLLEPSEYLDTDAKRNLYNNYEIKLPKALTIVNTGSGNSGPAIGYRSMPLVGFGSSPKKIAKRDAFFTELELDAILIVEIVMSITGDALYSISSNLLYNNPASGTKTVYGDYSEYTSVKLSSNLYDKKPKYSDIMVIKEVEYTNKRGKIKTRNEAVGLDPNLYKLTNVIVAENVRNLENFVLPKK